MIEKIRKLKTVETNSKRNANKQKDQQTRNDTPKKKNPAKSEKLQLHLESGKQMNLVIQRC